MAQVGPFLRVVDIKSTTFARTSKKTPTGKTMLVCLFRCPDNTGGGTGGIETGVRLVTFVCFAEVAVDAGAEL